MPVYIYMGAACLLLVVGGFFGLLTIAAMVLVNISKGNEQKEMLKGMFVCLVFSIVTLWASASMWPT